ncbi:HAD family hydrolase [Tumidithrix elongata]
MVAKTTIFLDGDDTLWKTQELYNDAKSKFAFLLNESGIPESQESIILKFDAMDALRVATRGLTPQRFTESMLILYSSLASQFSLEYKTSIEKKILDISRTIRQPPKLYEDTVDSLVSLKKEFRLILFTAGHPSTQKRKILSLHRHSFDVESYFDEIRIVPLKNEERLRRVLKLMKLSPHEVWFLGNSLRSDILPAVSVGANAVLVNRGAWKYDDKDTSHIKNIQWYTTSSLSDAAQIVIDIFCK